MNAHELSVEAREQIRDQAGMWCDLLLSHRDAESAQAAVTRRAELYMRVAGLSMAKVLDALEIDEDGWRSRLAELRAREQANLTAYERHAGRQEAAS